MPSPPHPSDLICPGCHSTGRLSQVPPEANLFASALPWAQALTCSWCTRETIFRCLLCSAGRAFLFGRTLVGHQNNCLHDADEPDVHECLPVDEQMTNLLDDQDTVGVDYPDVHDRPPVDELMSNLLEDQDMVDVDSFTTQIAVDNSFEMPDCDNDSYVSISGPNRPTTLVNWSIEEPEAMVEAMGCKNTHLRNFSAYFAGCSRIGPISRKEMKDASFFFNEHNRKGMGLVKSFERLFAPYCLVHPDRMHLSWVLYALLLAALLLEIGEDQRTKICLLLNLQLLMTSEDTSIPIKIPCSEYEISSIYVGTSSTKRTSCFMDLLPYPHHVPCGGSHRYFSLPQLVQYATASGHLLEPIHVLKGCSIRTSTFLHGRTPRGYEILKFALQCAGGYGNIPITLDESNINQINRASSETDDQPVGVVTAVLWSDSFEAASTKANRGSVWVCFISIGTPTPVFNSDCNTFLLAVGPSSANHDPVYRRLLQDLRDINTTGSPLLSYSRHHRCELRSYIVPYVLLQDTPEKTCCNGLSNFKAINGAYYGHNMDLNQKEGKLPSCSRCLGQRLVSVYALDQMPHAPNRCEVCFDWTPPLLRPITWSYLRQYFDEVLKKASNERIVDRKLIVAQLRRGGISPEISVVLADYVILSVNDPIHTTLNPSPPFPSLWLADPFFDVCESIEVVMHQLFLGIVKSTAKTVVQPFLAGRNQWSSYRQKSNNISAKIKELSLQWLRVLPMKDGGTHGGWVSENYLAYGRLLKYVASFVESIPATDDVYADPAIPLENFTLQQLKKWLAARNMVVNRPINRSRLLTIDYYNTVKATGWCRPGTPPLPISNPTRGVPLAVFIQTVCSCYAMVCQVMSITWSASAAQAFEVDRAVKLYLSADDRFHYGPEPNVHPERKISAKSTCSGCPECFSGMAQCTICRS
jgi:hypothetical protein